MASDTIEMRKAILHNLVNNQEYAQKVLPFIDENYFQEKHEKVIYSEIYKYFMKYDNVPSYSAVKIQVQERNDLTEAVFNEIETFLSKEVEPLNKVEFLVNKTEEWCQERAIVNAVYQAVNIIGGDDKKTPMTSLPDLLSKAIGTTFDNSVGHDYINEADERWEFYHKKEDKLSTGIAHLDYILHGGLPVKTLGAFLAGTGVGKSLMMCSISANVIKQGYNVLYISLEMAEEKIAQRIDQNLLDLTMEELEVVSKDNFTSRIGNIKSKTQGNLVVKEYPTKSAHAGHFKALIKELKQKKDFTPDLICIDYINICASLNAPKQSNSYTEVKSIAEELRGMAMEFNVPVLSATQTNRTGSVDADVDMTSVSDSFGLPMTLDYFFALTSNERLREENMMRISQLKNRFGNPDDRKNWLLGIDYAKMRVTDLEEQPRQIEEQNAAAKTSVTDTGPLMDKINARWG